MPTCRLEAPSCWCHSPPPWPPGADSPGAWLQNGTRVSGWAAQGPMGGGTAAVRYGGSRLLCGLQHPGRELSPGRTRECVTPRRSSRRKIGRTAETTPRARRVLCGHVRAPRPDSDVRSLPATDARATVQHWFCRLRSVPVFGVYIFNKLSIYNTFQRRVFSYVVRCVICSPHNFRARRRAYRSRSLKRSYPVKPPTWQAPV